jgi:hypothetical protein
VSSESSGLSQIQTPSGCTLRRKEQYEYVTPNNVYNVELFENQDGTFYAVGVPRDSQRLIVYGSSIVSSRQHALQMLVDKIQREGSLLGEETLHEEDSHEEE